MSCEQELNSNPDTCIFIPLTEARNPDGTCQTPGFDQHPVLPICFSRETVPEGYKCTMIPFRCTRPRVKETFEYFSLKNAYK